VGYDEGGQLTEAIRRRPYAVVLFDEIEKAHPDVFNILLQVLEDGRLTRREGAHRGLPQHRAHHDEQRGVGPHPGAVGREAGELKERLMDALRRTFRPEFLNRIDEIVTFKSLGPAEIHKIVDIQLEDLRKRMAERRITLSLSDEARDLLAERGYDPSSAPVR
jgi:ATP-dependent Clp protease ATP-binding subunit ClpB